MSEHRPEDSPNPITKTPIRHSGETVKREFDLSLDQANEQNKLFVPNTIGEPADLGGNPYLVFGENDPQEARAIIEANLQREATEKKRKRQTKIALIASGGVLLSSAVFGAVTTAANPGGLPQAPVASAPPVPGQGEPTPNISAPGQTEPTVTQAPGENVTYVPVTEADIKDYDALVESSKITHAEVKDGNNVLPTFVDRLNAILNVRLTEEEIAASKNMLSETGKVGPAALAEMKRSALVSSFGNKNTDFYKSLISKGEENFNYWLETRDQSDPFKAEFVQAGEGFDYGEYAYVTNVNKNSLEDQANATVYKFVSISAELRIPKGGKTADGNWVLTGQPKLVKTTETVPNP